MVSPLKTWQHQEPKGLWPALGGLAVVAHVGAIGLSLPYVMELMRPAGSRSVVVPIELIEVASAAPVDSVSDDLASSDLASDGSASDDSVSQETPTESNPESSSESNLESDSLDTSEPREAETPSALPTDSTLLSSESAAITEQTPPEQTQPEQTQPEQTQSEQPASTDPSTEAPAASTPAADSEASPEQETPLPTAPGDQPLPLPENSTGENAADKVAYLSVVDHSYVPTELLADVADTPPALDYSGATSLEATPQETGCGPVDFSQGQVTYRAVVGPDGRLRSAIPWTGSIEPRSISESESAIACLLAAANFSFTPAYVQGTAVANDSLLLTISVVESQP